MATTAATEIAASAAQIEIAAGSAESENLSYGGDRRAITAVDGSGTHSSSVWFEAHSASRQDIEALPAILI